MTWVKLESRIRTHPKPLSLSDSAHRLWIDLICWSADYETDGAISFSVPLASISRAKTPTRSIRELVDAKLVHEQSDGWQLHDFNDYQPSGEAQRIRREADRKRKRGDT